MKRIGTSKERRKEKKKIDKDGVSKDQQRERTLFWFRQELSALAKAVPARRSVAGRARRNESVVPGCASSRRKWQEGSSGVAAW